MMPSGSLMFCGQMAHLAAAMRVHVKQLCKYQFSPNCQCWRAWELHIRPYICILQLIVVQRTQPQQEPGRFNLMRNSISSMWKENYKTEFLFSLFKKTTLPVTAEILIPEAELGRFRWGRLMGGSFAHSAGQLPISAPHGASSVPASCPARKESGA